MVMDRVCRNEAVARAVEKMRNRTIRAVSESYDLHLPAIVPIRAGSELGF